MILQGELYEPSVEELREKIQELNSEILILTEENKKLDAETLTLKGTIKELEEELEYYKNNYDPYWAGENDYD